MYTQFTACSFVATAFDFNSCNDQIHVHKQRYAYSYTRNFYSDSVQLPTTSSKYYIRK